MNKITGKIFGILIIGLLTLNSPVQADGPDWTGLYLGGGASYADADGDRDVTPPQDVHQSVFNFDENDTILFFNIGLNYQTGNFVVGGEADFTDIGMDKATDCPVNGTCSAAVNGLATARLRGGWLVQPNTLLYLTGGWAWSEYEIGRMSPGRRRVPPVNDSVHPDVDGWTAGIGIETFPFGSTMGSVKFEYLHVDLDNKDYIGTNGGLHEFETDLDIFRIGANMHF